MWGSHSVSKEGHFWERIKWDTKIKSPLKPFSLLVGQGELNSVLQADVCLRSYVRRVSHPLSHIWLFAIPWTITCQAPLSMGSSRQEYWSGLPFPSPILTLGTITKCTCPSGLGGRGPHHPAAGRCGGHGLPVRAEPLEIALCGHMVPGRRTAAMVTVTWLSVSPGVCLGLVPSRFPRKPCTNTKALVL